MNIRLLHASIMLMLLLLSIGCDCKGNKEDKQQNTTVRDKNTVVINDIVTTKKIFPTNFNMEIISNGKIEAKNILSLTFERSGFISNIYVENGEYVAKGQIIAKLDQSEVKRQIEKAELNCEESELQLKDILIGQGYSYENKNAIPEKMLRTALIKSGYLRNKKNLEDFRQQVDKTILRAPFAGVIANMKAHTGSMTNQEPVCDIIDTKSLEVCFPVLQNEIGLIKSGEPVVVKTFDSNSKAIHGRIVSINPIVEDNGQISVRASIAYDNSLMTGMSLSVFINKSIENQIAVPKTAVVERSGRKVIFTVKEGKAVWNYVNIGFQNTTQYTITDGLEPGDEIVTSGAQNLSDGIPLTIKN